MINLMITTILDLTFVVLVLHGIIRIILGIIKILGKFRVWNKLEESLTKKK